MCFNAKQVVSFSGKEKKIKSNSLTCPKGKIALASLHIWSLTTGSKAKYLEEKPFNMKAVSYL